MDNMNPIRSVNRWIEQPARPFDPVGNALFRMNKALLVYVALPLIVLVALVAVL